MKRKVNINRPQISADEINQRKNFDSALNQHIKATTKPFFKKPWFLTSMASITIAVVTTLVIINNKPDKPNEQQTTNNQPARPAGGQPTTNSSDSLALAEFYAAEEAKPCINPPLKDIDIPFTSYRVNAQKGAILTFETGSTITIPKNAFTDDNGKIIKGEVEIKYREFHDVVDILVAGIPMTYDSAGVRYHFETAGMMEISGYQKGKKINIAPDKNINVELASNDESTKFNLYKLDTIKNNWSCIGKDKVKKQNPSSTQKVVTYDSIVPENFSYSNPIEQKKIEIKKEKEQQIAALPKLPAEPLKPQKLRKDKYTFNIEVNEKEFPELAIYKGALFEVSDEEKNFNKSMYDITWDDAKLKKSGNNNYTLLLQKSNKNYEFKVSPVFDSKNYDNAMKSFDEKYKQYGTALEKRTKEEKRIEAEFQAKIEALKKEQEEMAKKYKEEEDKSFKSMDNQQKIFRTFNVNGFGVYNCDNPMKYPQGTVTSAQLLNDKNVKLLCYNVYLVDKKLNGVYTYYKNPLTKFTYNPTSENILWTVEDGVLYYLKPEDFKQFNSSKGLLEIKMKQIPADIKTADGIKEFFNI